MIRRQFISAVSIPSVFSGCTRSTNNQSLSDEGVIWIANSTDTDQTVDVLITGEADSTVFSEQYELAPDDTGGNSEVGDVGSTYHVEVTTNDHEEKFEWQMARNRSILNIYIEHSDVRFERDASEG
ncbi:hypothetical protein [Natronococcus sp.]|uniref:hypothetical protein n=1 Tax=Natronococcus sp. TaxID=35747 RepID=UPI0025D2698C|nr:hypothetical protein [Natronococcus sp.]